MLDLTVKLFQFKLLLSIEDCELWWFDIFASFSLVQPIRLFEPFVVKCFQAKIDYKDLLWI